jgi:sugar-specific transcriptional regulator TrmB
VSLAEIDLNRGTTYDILKKLQEIGLVSYYHQDTKQRFVAEDPEKLSKLVENKKEELKNIQEKIIDFIPELKSLQDKGGNKPVTRFYEGREGIRFILDDVLLLMGETEEKEFMYSAGGEDVYSYPDFTRGKLG